MNIKQKLALLAVTAGTTSAAFAGKVAEAITGNEAVTGASADLYTIGGVVVGIVVVTAWLWLIPRRGYSVNHNLLSKAG